MNIILPNRSSDTEKVSEIIAVALINLATKSDLTEFEIMRTDDPSVYTNRDMTEQVTVRGQGHIYDPDRSRFDYHQEGFDHLYYAVASTHLGLSGMMWLKYGPTIVRDIVGDLSDIDGICLYIYEKLFEAIDAQDNHVKSLHMKTCFDWLNYANLDGNKEFAEYMNITCRYLEKHIPNLCKRHNLESEERVYFEKLVGPNKKPNYCIMDRHLVTLNELDPLEAIAMIIEVAEDTCKVFARGNLWIPVEQTLKSMMPHPTELVSVNRFRDQAVTTTLDSAKFIVEATLKCNTVGSTEQKEQKEQKEFESFAAFTESLRALKTSQE